MPDIDHAAWLAQVRLIVKQLVQAGVRPDAPATIDILRAVLEGALGAGIETLGAGKTYDLAQAMLDDIALQVADMRGWTAKRKVL